MFITQIHFSPLAAIWGQTFEPHDLVLVGLLIVLEGVLSIDNALVLGLLARRLPKQLQKKALTYGLIGAFAFRLLAIGMASYLLHWHIVKLVGGAYLIYVAGKHFVFERNSEPLYERAKIGAELTPAVAAVADQVAPKVAPPEDSQAPAAPGRRFPGFWPTVFVIEMTDIAFAVDSIIAALGVVGPAEEGATRHHKLWVVVVGGFIGLVVMRFAAVLFIKLLERFPHFETAAYMLVTVIGAKLVAEWALNRPPHPHLIDFHNIHNPAFWIFWILMLGCFCVGFLPGQKTEPQT